MNYDILYRSSFVTRWFNRIAAALIAFQLFATQSYSSEATQPEDPLGRTISDFQLNDSRGKEYTLREFADKPVVVVAFLGTECPLAKFYSRKLELLQKEYEAKGVVILGVDTNAQDSLAEIAAFARRHEITYPILKDEAHRVANSLGATRTPEVFVLDAQRVVRYYGRIDDQYGIGYQRGKAEHQEMRDAIEDILASRTVAIGHSPAVGCIAGRSPAPREDSDVTYAEHIAPILQARCVECHRDGEIAPMALTDYDEVSGWAEMIDEVVREKRMPPWHANSEYGHFANDRSLTEEQRSLIHRWVDAGAPEGNPEKLPPPREYTTGWQLSRAPDAVFAMSKKPFQVPANGTVRYRYFNVDPGFTEDKWITAAEIQPSNRAVVHHVLIFTRAKGSGRRMDGQRGFLAAYVPGSRVRPFPAGMAKRIPAGHEIVFQVHYTPIGTPQSDVTSIGFLYANPVDITHEVITTSALQDDLEIPPGDANYQTSAMLPETLPACQLLTLSPHMHLRGKSFRFQLVSTSGDRETVLDIPHYDFNWQTAYTLDQPRDLPAGTRMFCEAAFDNSEKNLNNPDPKRTVYWGDQTYDEMMIGYFDIAVPKK